MGYCAEGVICVPIEDIMGCAGAKGLAKELESACRVVRWLAQVSIAEET